MTSFQDSYCDATIACDGLFYPVHKIVLSTCSEYFDQIFQRTQCKHPVIVLKDVRSDDLEALLNYMYLGEVNVLQDRLSGLIKNAESLRIKGLAVPDEEPKSVHSSSKENKRTFSSSDRSPQPKRRRAERDSEDVNNSERSRNKSNSSQKTNDHGRTESESQNKTGSPDRISGGADKQIKSKLQTDSFDRDLDSDKSSGATNTQKQTEKPSKSPPEVC